ncbi:hypothetical protein AAHA92_23512 [Salvia divinorum]|uniref:Alpha/beta hydrolase fold-3 domain-containing protein n=1 Tax=Salvia divinorum TaxID=28513 RepID=A0ABD1GW08_SALDI
MAATETELEFEFLPFFKAYKNGRVERLKGTDVVPAEGHLSIISQSHMKIHGLHYTGSHCNGDGPEPMLNHHADFQRVFLAGDSARANIVHNLAMAAGHPDGGLNVGIRGVVLVDPYFWGSDPIGSEGLDMEKKAYVDRLWNVVCPSCPIDDPWINPVGSGGMSLAGLGCWRVLVTVAEKDILKDRGWLYFQALSRSGWLGAVKKAKQRLKKIAEFFKMELPPMAFQ